VRDLTPLGVTFLGTAWSESRLLRYAFAYEKGTQRRVPPTRVNDELVTGCP
jgi:Asp-tRNA(Asn)/Glu-tRNA(Gln) amidotransferase A subunit family amidase